MLPNPIMESKSKIYKKVKKIANQHNYKQCLKKVNIWLYTVLSTKGEGVGRQQELQISLKATSTSKIYYPTKVKKKKKKKKPTS